ncbi:hypothetical protein PQX77_020482 [Marasmius sp. AFHP31]|nr:hypothetical protein PQX77_020482 [Marasmius sp. AFHP31]
MVSPRKRPSSLNLLLHLKWDASSSRSDESDGSVDDDSSSRSSRSSHDSDRDSEESFGDNLGKEVEKEVGKEVGQTGMAKSMETLEPQISYYDEFSRSADLSALSVTFEDVKVLDEDPFASDPFAATPPVSPISPRFPPNPVSPSKTSTPAPHTSFLETDPYASLPASPRRLSAAPLPKPPSHQNSHSFTRVGASIQSVPAPSRTPSSAVLRHSPLSPVKSTFATPALPSNDAPIQPRRRLKSSPQQPSLDMLSVFVLKAAPHRRPRGTVGANLPLEPWGYCEVDLTAQFPEPSLRSTSHLSIRGHQDDDPSQRKTSLRPTPSVDSLKDAASEHIRPYHTLSRAHSRNKTVWDIGKFW